MRKIGILLLAGIVCCNVLLAQELRAKVNINFDRVGSKVDNKVFKTLQSALTSFLNNRKWTNQTFRESEKIACNFLLNISSLGDNNAYQATLTIQAARPVYNSSYDSPLINYMDDNVAFRYSEFQPLEFNENNVSGNDALSANLTAVFAYYAYLILAMEFDSFSLRGGDPYFQKMQNIVSNAPDSREMVGWKAFDGQRNRYWLMENFTNNRYTLIHDAIFNYYRKGLDKMYDSDTEGRAGVMNALNQLNSVNTDNPNLMIMQFLFQGKSTELIKMFKKAPLDERSRIVEMLSRIDVSNSNAYKQELK